MIPHVQTVPAFHVPAGTRYPDPSKVSEEGYGLFRGTWVIGSGWPVADARALIGWERTAISTIDRLADSEVRFDDLARALETADPDDDAPLAGAGLASLEPFAEEAGEMLEGLELGVAGLVAALSACGFFPAASCRGHPDAWAWADRPTVFFGGSGERVGLLRDVILSCGACVGDGSQNGDGLVVVQTPSVRAATELAERVLDLGLSWTEADSGGLPRPTGWV